MPGDTRCAVLARNFCLLLVCPALMLVQDAIGPLESGRASPSAPSPAEHAPAPIRRVELYAAFGVPGVARLVRDLDLTVRSLRLDLDFVVRTLTDTWTPERFAPRLLTTENARPLVLNGHGDYHHLSYYLCRDWIDRFGLPFTIVNFDSHDDAKKDFRLHCGSWINRALKRCRHLERAVVVGVKPFRRGDYARWVSPEYARGRLLVFPAPRNALDGSIANPAVFHGTRPAFPRPDIRSARPDLLATLVGAEGYRIVQQSHATIEPERIAAAVSTRFVYVTVDMDVLHPDDFDDVGWGTGSLRVDEVIRIVRALSARCVLIGADVCGFPPNRKEKIAPGYRRAKGVSAYGRLIAALRAAMQARAR